MTRIRWAGVSCIGSKGSSRAPRAWRVGARAAAEPRGHGIVGACRDRIITRRDRRAAAIADWAEPHVSGHTSRYRIAGLDLTLVIGSVALAATALQVLVLPPGPVAVVTAAIATLAFMTDRRLGPLPAALLVALAIPWGRGADTLTWEVGGLPIRAHDAIILIGMLGALPALVRRRPRWGLTLVLLLAFMVLGVIAVGVGVVLDHPFRDVFRDVRWWVFYGAAILALFGAASRAQITRGLLIGMTIFAGLVILAAVLPSFSGGLKEQELLYDRGTLRMQFSNSAFLLPAIAYVASSVLDRRRVADAGWLLLLITAVVLSLTRTSMFAAALVVALVFIADLVAVHRSGGKVASRARGVVGLALAGGLALVLGIGIDIVGTPPASEVATSVDGGGEQPIDRILFQGERSDIGSLEEGRFPSYRAAAHEILDSPIVGQGMGSLTKVDYAYSEARANTIGYSPGVDNAYLTVGLKTGVPGMLVFGGMVLATLYVAFRRGGQMGRWFLPAWIGLLILSMTQAFAGSLYGPYVFALLIALPSLRWDASAAREPAPPGPG